MHELALARAMIDEALGEARRRGAARVRRIHCRIGRLRMVDPAMLREAFELARAGTQADDAELVTTPVGMHLCCRTCGAERDLEGWSLECPACGSRDIALSGGDEIELTSLELEVPDGD
jgi:hydrogenase nickel incorporation protein HypA/HybF